jgi:hypothetical protein
LPTYKLAISGEDGRWRSAEKVEAAVDVLAEYGPVLETPTARVGEQEAARRRGAIMAEQWGYQLR